MRREKLNIFYCALKESMEENVKKNPEKYPKGYSVDSTVDKICRLILDFGIKSVDTKTDSFKIACKKLGIKNTYKAIEDFLKN